MPGRRRDLGKPLWRGEFPPQRQTMLLHAEQGLGDTILFARYAPLVARMGARVVLEVPPELAGLLGRLDGVAAVVARGAALPAFDLHCPMGSLPLALQDRGRQHSGGARIWRRAQERIAQWRARLPRSHPAGRVRLGGQARPSR